MSPTFDIARYPAIETIRLLASLLERMCVANDQLSRVVATSRSRKDLGRRASSASLVAASCSQADATPLTDITHCTRFHARTLPNIDIFSYLSRILKYCPCSNECFLSLLVYFDRMSKNSLSRTGRPFTIDSYNIHRLLITGIMVSSKFFSDVYYTNTRYAKVGGLSVGELNNLELEFLALNDFNLSVPISELQRYGDQLLKVGFMEQEMLKNLMYEKPSSYNNNSGAVRHARSTSLGSSTAMRHHSDNTIDRLCDMTTGLSMDDHRRAVFDTLPQQQQQQQQQQPGYAAYTSQQPLLTKMSSNGSLRSGGGSVRRMTSLGNMNMHYPHSPHAGYNTPMSNHDSPIALAGDDDDYRRTNQYTTSSSAIFQHGASPDRRQQRHSMVVGDVWRQSTCSPPPQQYVRQRHGSMGLVAGRSSSPDTSIWQPLPAQHNQHRLPRHSRSSINLYQQANFRKSTPPGLVDPAVAAAAAAAAAMSYGSYYSYNAHPHPLGIPTPPPSSSPIHHHTKQQQQQTSCPYQPVSSSPSSSSSYSAAGHFPSSQSSMYL